MILIAGLVLFLTRDNTPVAEPAPNATELTGEYQPLAPGAYYVDTDGDEETATRGTFVIEGDGWTALPSGALKEGDGEHYVALLVVEVDEVWSSCMRVNRFGGGGDDGSGSGQPVRHQWIDRPGAVGAGQCLRPRTGTTWSDEVPAGCAGEVKPAWTGAVFDRALVRTTGDMVEYWFLDVEGTPVMIEASWVPGSSPEEDVTELQDGARHPGDHSLGRTFWQAIGGAHGRPRCR